MPRYHGFTCPKCGCHYFGTYRNTGQCHGEQHGGKACGFTWDRTDPEQESECMYEQTLAEWMSEYKPKGNDGTSG